MLRRIIKNLFYLFSILLPHRKTILFESGDNVFDNGFVLAKHVAQQPKYKKYKLICVGKRKEIVEDNFSKKIHYLFLDDSFKSHLRFLKISFRAKFIFFSYDNYWKYIKLRKSTKIIFVRHGAFPIKSVKDYYDSMFDNENHYYVLCTTPFVKQQIEMKYPKQNVTNFLSGMPRCDLLKIDNAGEVFDSFGIDKNSKVVIIACTFRHFDDPDSSFFKDEFPIPLSEEDICELNNRVSKCNVVLLFKLHHAQFCNIESFHYSNIVFVDDRALAKNKLNNFDLFNASSALVTDYSGIFIDYLLTNKPLGFIMADKEKYNNKRGFTISNFEKYLPGEIILNKSELFDFVSREFLDKQKFEKQRLDAKYTFIGEYTNCCESLLNEAEKL